MYKTLGKCESAAMVMFWEQWYTCFLFVFLVTGNQHIMPLWYDNWIALWLCLFSTFKTTIHMYFLSILYSLFVSWRDCQGAII